MHVLPTHVLNPFKVLKMDLIKVMLKSFPFIAEDRLRKTFLSYIAFMVTFPVSFSNKTHSSTSNLSSIDSSRQPVWTVKSNCLSTSCLKHATHIIDRLYFLSISD